MGGINDSETLSDLLLASVQCLLVAGQYPRAGVDRWFPLGLFGLARGAEHEANGRAGCSGQSVASGLPFENVPRSFINRDGAATNGPRRGG